MKDRQSGPTSYNEYNEEQKLTFNTAEQEAEEATIVAPKKDLTVNQEGHVVAGGGDIREGFLATE